MATFDIKMAEGGLGAVRGLRTAGVSAGFRRNPERRDLALLVVDDGATAAGVFTQNRFAAAPVELSRKHLAAMAASGASARALVVNSGNANATTGEPGMATAAGTAALAAGLLGCEAEQVLVASTGVIGVPLALGPFQTGLPAAMAALSDGSGSDVGAGLAAAEAIMTTDTTPKEACARVIVQEGTAEEQAFTVAGMCKGSGMIQPDMATMIAVMATDAALPQADLALALREAVAVSFNKVTVDSDTSTNDSAYLFATGASGVRIEPDSPTFDAFAIALVAVCQELARMIARDGEGATKLVTVYVCGAASNADADAAARSIANSPLVKTAIAGHDANWGRIAMALGKSGAAFNTADVRIELMGMKVCERGLPVPFDEQEAMRLFNELSEIVIDAQIGQGSGEAMIWTCDLTHDYISINADYRT